jgi:hypothetical protein
MATVTKSNAQNISSPNGNSLALFINLNGVLTLKDIYGVTQELTTFITSGVSSFSAVKGTFISMTNNTGATGVIDMGTINLSATGTPNASNFLRGDNTWDVPVGTQYSAGSGLSLSGTEFSNSAPDQTVSLSEGTAITISGTYPNFTITNAAPDQTVSLSEGTAITISGTYPNFTITNAAPDQTVSLSEGTAITISGTYPNFTITNDSPNATHTGDVTGSGALIIANDVISYAKLGAEFKTSAALTTEVDFATAQVFTKTLTAATTLTFSNASIGMVKDLVITGDFALTLPAGTTVAGTYDGTVSNLIQIVVTGATEYWYSISKSI